MAPLPRAVQIIQHCFFTREAVSPGLYCSSCAPSWLEEVQHGMIQACTQLGNLAQHAQGWWFQAMSDLQPISNLVSIALQKNERPGAK